MGQRRARRESGALEAEILATLWASDAPLTPADLQHQLPEGLAYTTIMTTLGRLADKGQVERERVGRGFVYRPVEEEASHLAGRMNDLVERGHDRQAVLQRFVAGLSPSDGELLATLLEQTERN